ncbi:MAG: hypothetical protein OEV93_02135 [Candidatus Moranbacteria bacterium]|nr:hypothetical protein [Candidatus Moranbacteria bacterium]
MDKVEKILKENNLVLGEGTFLISKKNVLRVKDEEGSSYALKIQEIDPFQLDLMELAEEMKEELCFRVPHIVKRGEDWALFEEIHGESLNVFYDKKPEWCVEVSKKIADDYQKLISRLKEKKDIGDLLKRGNEWHLRSLRMWSSPIIKEGLMTMDEFEQIKNDFKNMIDKKGEEAFGWSHGNIIGDHIIVDGDDFFLLDLAVVPRIGKGYYDFLRAMDWFFIKSKNPKKDIAKIKEWIKKHTAEFDENEVKLVFAFRMIGVLGWDMFENNVGYFEGDVDEKADLAMKFIRRE